MIGVTWSERRAGSMLNLPNRDAVIDYFAAIRFNSAGPWRASITVRETPAVVFDPTFERKIWDYFASEVAVARKQRVLFGQILLQTYGDPVP